MNISYGKGVFFAVGAYFLWGIFPIYWKLLSEIHSLHLVAFRILLAFAAVCAVLFAQKRFSWLRFFKDKRQALPLVAMGLVISFNWSFYIWAINSGYIIEASLGIFITPLVSAIMGFCFLREKLKPMQYVAFAFAFVGVIILTILTGVPPWISIIIALIYACYGLLRKYAPLPALESLGAETLVALPIGLALLFLPISGQDLSFLSGLSLFTTVMLLLCGLATILPLYLFAKGMRVIKLSTLSVIQLLSPAITFLVGFFLYGETFPSRNFIAFGFIWFGAIVYIVSGFKSKREE